MNLWNLGLESSRLALNNCAIRNISRSSPWSSWLISLLISDISNKEYNQKSSVGVLVNFLADSIHLI